jgi:hypothetical protein
MSCHSSKVLVAEFKMYRLVFVTTTASLKRRMWYSHWEIADICTYLHTYDSSSRNSRASDTGCKYMDLSAV